DAVVALLSTSDSQITLAEFQRKAIVEILHTLEGHRDRDIVVGAGTGAGKTKAFYIPALAEIAAELKRDLFRVQALAIYPRKELLKDQLAEALSESHKLDDLLLREQKRPIVLGA